MPSDFSKRRSSIIREACNTETSTQGYAGERLAFAAAGMRDETKNATEVEVATGNSERTVSKVGRWHSSQWTGSRHRCTLEKRSEYSRIRKSKNWCIYEDLAKDKMMFSEVSTRAIFEMGNVELIELKKSSVQCP